MVDQTILDISNAVRDLADIIDDVDTSCSDLDIETWSGRLQRDKNEDILTLEDFGAIGDGTLHTVQEWIDEGKYVDLNAIKAVYPHVTSTTDSIDWAAVMAFVSSNHHAVYVKRVYVLNKSVPIHRSLSIIGRGFLNNINEAGIYYKTEGSTFIFQGAGTKEYTAYGVCSGEANGGSWNNPDSRFIEDTVYNQTSFYNNNGKPITFSAGFYIGKGVSGVNFSDLQIIKSFNGVDGYKQGTNGWGDDWDVGVYFDNARYCLFKNVSVLGYWLIAGRFIRSGGLSTETYLEGYAGAEENKFLACSFQGHVSSLERGVSMFKILSVNTSTKMVTVPLFEGEPFTHAQKVCTGEFATSFAHVLSVNKNYNDNTIELTLDTTSGFSANGLISAAFYGNGVSGTVDMYCRFLAMSHTSKHTVSDTWHNIPMKPSKCIELGGARMRGRRYEGCKLQTIDDVHIHAHQVIDLILSPNMRYESDKDALDSAGCRMIGTNMNYPHYVREVYRVQMHTEQDGSDFRPNGGISQPLARTTNSNGMWMCTHICNNFATQGIYFGSPLTGVGLNTTRKLSNFYTNGYTQSMNSSGVWSTSGISRSAIVQIIQGVAHVSTTLRIGSFTNNTDGNLSVSLPSVPNADRLLPVTLTDYNYPKQVYVQLTPGSNSGQLMYLEDTSTYTVSTNTVTKNPKGTLRPLKVSDLKVGNAILLSMSLIYPTDDV